MAQAVSNIAQARALSGHAKAWLWEFIIPQVPAGAGDISEVLTFRARASVLPGRQIVPILDHFRGHEMEHPGRNRFSRSMPVRFVEGLTGRVATALEAWYEAWLSESDGSSSGEDSVVTDAFMRMLDHSNEVVLQYHLYRFYIKEWPDTAVEYAAEGFVNFETTFGYSYWLLE